jgi:hypothetical protein
MSAKGDAGPPECGVVRHEKEIIAALKVGGGDERRRVFKYWEESTVANSAEVRRGTNWIVS